MNPVIAGALAVSGSASLTSHTAWITRLTLLALALAALFCALRPEIWQRVFLARVDPRPAGLLRIVFGAIVLTTWIDLLPDARFLLTDEGLWLTEMARRNSSKLAYLWDPLEGFEHWWMIFPAMWGKFSVLHLRSDPPFVYAIYTALLVSLTLMTLGLKTRLATFAAWILQLQLYGYSTIFLQGGDQLIQTLLFLGVFARWGRAYSIDACLRRRRALRGGARTFPVLERIPAWPLRLMMFQVTVMYCCTGLAKSGATWWNGTALYYALNLAEFYRVPMTGAVGLAQHVGLLPVLTRLVHGWEILFPLALVGVAINGYEGGRGSGDREPVPAGRRYGSWIVAAGMWTAGSLAVGIVLRYWRHPPGVAAAPGVDPDWTIPIVAAALVALGGLAVAAYRPLRRRHRGSFDVARRWLLGKRTWLGFGVLTHLGIELSMNVGVFGKVTLASYLAWVSGSELDAAWRYLFSRACRPGQGPRPARVGWRRWICAPLDRLRFRRPGPGYVVLHAPDAQGIRRAALLRGWDVGHRLRFEKASSPTSELLRVRVGSGPTLDGAEAASALTGVFPALWWLWPWGRIPGLTRPAGWLAIRILGLRP